MVLVLGILLAAPMTLRSVASIFIGRRAASEMLGVLAADVVRWTVLLPFRLGRSLYRSGLGGGGTTLARREQVAVGRNSGEGRNDRTAG